MRPQGHLRVDQLLTSELYGLESARPPQVEDDLRRRKALLSKPDLSDEDRAELHAIEERVGELAAGETSEEREAIAFLKDFADRLKGETPAEQPDA
jgi:hypothetical protein